MLLGIAARVSLAHEGHSDAKPPATNQPSSRSQQFPCLRRFDYDTPDRTVQATPAADALSYEADIFTRADGTTSIAWLQYTPHHGDTIWLGTWADDGVSNAVQITGQPGQFARPTLSETADGSLWLSYEQQIDGQWDVFVMRQQDGAFGQPRKVSQSSGSDIRHQAVATGDSLWFTWQSDHGGQFDIVCRRASRDSLGESTFLSNSPRGDWHPQIAVSPAVDGNEADVLFVAWDRFNGDSYDVVLRVGRSSKADVSPEWGPALAVAGSPAFEGRVQLAAAPDGGAWIGWEEGAENWGQPYRARRGQEELYLKLHDTHGPLHRYRRLRLGHVSANGQIRAVDPLPQPSFDAALHRGDGQDSLPHGAYYERSKLAVDGSGRLWVAYRHVYAPWMGIEPHHHVEEGWGVYARCLTRGGWSELTQLDIGQGDVAQGDGMQRLELTSGNDGITATWTAGRTDRRPNEIPRGVHVATVSAAGSATERRATASVAIHGPTPSTQSRRRRQRSTACARSMAIYIATPTCRSACAGGRHD